MTGVDAAVERWLREKDDIVALLETWGIDLTVADRTAAICQALRANVQADIPDLTRFRAAVTDAVALGELNPYRVANVDLLREVAALGEDRSAILERLNRHPVDEQVAYLEIVPILRGKVTSWRTPVDQSVLRKRPRQADRFLEDLETLLRDPHGVPVRQAAEQLRRAVTRENGYVVTPLLTLFKRLEAETMESGNAAKLHRLRQLLRTMLEAERDETRSAWVAAAWSYRNAGWALRSVERCILAALLSPPCAEFAWTLSGWNARRHFALLKREVEGGMFSPRELRLRLRYWLLHGAYVPTIVFDMLSERAADARQLSLTRRGGHRGS